MEALVRHEKSLPETLSSQSEARKIEPFATLGKAACPYCGVGCRVTAKGERNLILDTVAEKADAPNFGHLCQKGSWLKGIFRPEGRLTRPLHREEKNAPWKEVSWEDALSIFARKTLTARRDHGPDSFAFYGSGQLDSEACYLATKLVKGFLGTNQMDTNSRLCMSSAVAAYVHAFGSDGPPCCYDDIDEADLFLIVGANMAVNHPVLMNRIRKRKAERPETLIVVIDPRANKTAEMADVHLDLHPGSDVALLSLLARRILDDGLVDFPFLEAHAEFAGAYLGNLATLPVETLSRVCGIAPERLDPILERFARNAKVLSLYCQGVNQSTHGTDNNLAIIHLHLLTGRIGKPGCGPFSLTGQPNAMGGRETGYLAQQLPGYRFVADPVHRAEMETFWKIAPGSIRSEPGPPAVELFRKAGTGEIKVLWIACTNPAASMPDSDRVNEALASCEFVVAQDCMHPTETTLHANLLLPAAQWGEKAGTMTNSERRVQRGAKMVEPPGEARPDWWIIDAFARELGFEGFDHSDHRAVWDEIRGALDGRPCDVSGITNARLENDESIRWPCTGENDPGTARLYEDGVFRRPGGKARLTLLSWRPAAEAPSEELPYVLTTGRVYTQWHTRTRTGRVPELNRISPEPFIEIHPDDALRHRILEGEKITLVGRRGRCGAKATITTCVSPGTLFMPLHWGRLFASDSDVNAVTSPAYDPVSKQPELKYAAVRIETSGESFASDSFSASESTSASSAFPSKASSHE